MTALHIEAHQLLVVRDDPSLARRGAIAIEENAVTSDTLFAQHFHELPAGFVGADDPAKVDASSKRADVVGDIGCAAQL